MNIMFNQNLFENFNIDNEIKKKNIFNFWTIAISILSIIFSSLNLLLSSKKKVLLCFLIIALAITVICLTIIEKDNMTIYWFNNNADISNGLLLALSILCFIMAFLLLVLNY